MKYVYLWEFNYDLITPKFTDMYGQVNYEAEEVLKEGWNPTYLYGEGAAKEIIKFNSKFSVDTFDGVGDSKFIYDFSSDCYYEIIDEKIYEQGVTKTKILHILVKKHLI
jgi:hypothetical protein